MGRRTLKRRKRLIEHEIETLDRMCARGGNDLLALQCMAGERRAAVNKLAEVEKLLEGA